MACRCTLQLRKVPVNVHLTAFGMRSCTTFCSIEPLTPGVRKQRKNVLSEPFFCSLLCFCRKRFMIILIIMNDNFVL